MLIHPFDDGGEGGDLKCRLSLPYSIEAAIAPRDAYPERPGMGEPSARLGRPSDAVLRRWRGARRAGAQIRCRRRRPSSRSGRRPGRARRCRRGRRRSRRRDRARSPSRGPSWPRLTKPVAVAWAKKVPIPTSVRPARTAGRLGTSSSGQAGSRRRPAIPRRSGACRTAARRGRPAGS